MASLTKFLYEGDGLQTQFNIPFPYLSTADVVVTVNLITQLKPGNISVSGNTITFLAPPAAGAGITVQRISSPDVQVDFVNGSILNESDLDTGYLHNLYLVQEATDIFNEYINAALLALSTDAGIITIPNEDIMRVLATDLLNQEVATDLLQRITDIDLNAEAIASLGTELQIQVNTIAAGVAAIVFIQPEEPIPGIAGIPDPIPEGARWYDSDDFNHAYVYISNAWLDILDPRVGQSASDITQLQVESGDNAAAITETNIAFINADLALTASLDVAQVNIDANVAAIVAESVTRADADSATASTLALIGAENLTATAFIIDLDTAFVGANESMAVRFSSITSTADATDAAVAQEVLDRGTAITQESIDRGAAIGQEATARDAAIGAEAVNTAAALAASVTDRVLVTDALSATIVTEASTSANATLAVANELHLMGVSNVGGTAFILNSNTTLVDVEAGSTLAQTLTAVGAQAVADSGAVTSAAIATEQAVRLAADNAIVSTADLLRLEFDAVEGEYDATATLVNLHTASISSTDAALTITASDVSALEATVDGPNGVVASRIVIDQNVSAVQDLETFETSMNAHYGVSLNVNGHITGFAQNNDGTTGSFVVVADNFAVIEPNNVGGLGVIPFAITNGIVHMQNVVIGNAVIENLNVGKLTGGTITAGVTLNADWQIGTGRIVYDNGTHMKVSGTGFGASSDLIEWFGVRPLAANIALCSKANAITYLGTDGSAYFGGTLSAGTLFHNGQSADITVNSEIIVGPFGTNGGAKTVLVSYLYGNSQIELPFNPTGTDGDTITSTINVSRRINGGGWTLISSDVFSGTYHETEDIPGVEWSQTESVSGSRTSTDSLTTIAQFEYKAEVITRTNNILVVNNMSQNLSLQITEE